MSQAAAESRAGASTGRLSISVIVAYALPMAGFSAATMTLSLYLLKYSADVLLIPPAAMGLIFMVGRVWDAVTDPVAGQLSDRTSTHWGRRRPWMVAAALPPSRPSRADPPSRPSRGQTPPSPPGFRLRVL